MSPRLCRCEPLVLACALAVIGSASCEPPPDPAGGQKVAEPIEARHQALFAALPGGWSTTAVGSNGLPGSASYDDVTNSFGTNGAGNNISGTADNFYFVYRAQSGDGEIVARMTGISGGTSARHGIMIRSSSATNSSHVFLFQQPDQTVGYTRRAGVGTGSFHDATSAGAKFHWLKLVRRGSAIQSYTSADGLTWTAGLTATLSGLGSTALYGIAVCSYDTGATARSYADNVGVTRLPYPYSDADVGATGASGTASFDYPTQTWTVRGAGAGAASTSDSFHFAYRTLIGDGELIARAASVSGPSTSRAGIMLRNSLTASSSHAFLWSTPSGGVGLTRRAAGGVSSSHFLPPGGDTNRWMRLVRAGTTVDGYESADGVAWTLVASSNLSDLGTTVYVGFAGTSRVSGTLSTAVLDGVAFKPAQSQRPNMVPWVGNWQVIPDDEFLPDSHDVQDGCVTAGTHKVLRFDFQSRNHGRTDAVVGQPSQRPDLFVWSLAHQHRHFLDYNRYFLRNGSGVVVAGKKESFCLEDTDRIDAFGAPDAKFFCANDGIQGVAAGWLDEYGGELPCQYIVLDGVPPGSYTLEAITNANRFVVEDDYSDNSTAVTVEVP